MWMSDHACGRFAVGSFIILIHSPPGLFPLCREQEIPCFSLEGVSHLTGPSTVRLSSNSVSTVWMTATSRRWVKRLLSTSIWARDSCYGSSRCFADLSFWSVCICCGPVIADLVHGRHWWRLLGPECCLLNPECFFFFLVITCMIISVTKRCSFSL